MAKFTAPYHLLIADAPCWSCDGRLPLAVFTATMPADDPRYPAETVFLADIQELPAFLWAALRVHECTMQRRHSKTAGAARVMNICPNCKRHYGEWFMFQEPDSPFWTYPHIFAGRRIAIEGPTGPTEIAATPTPLTMSG